MLQAEIISLSKSSYSFYVLMMPKKNGEKRFCVAFKQNICWLVTDFEDNGVELMVTEPDVHEEKVKDYVDKSPEMIDFDFFFQSFIFIVILYYLKYNKNSAIYNAFV